MSGMSLHEGLMHPIVVDHGHESSSQKLNIRLNTREKAKYDQLINETRMRLGAPDRLLHEGDDLDALYNAICETVRPTSRYLINKESILLGVNRKKDSTRIEVYYTRLRRHTPEQRQKISDRFSKKVEVLRIREDKVRAKAEKERQAKEQAEQIEHEKRLVEQGRAALADFEDKVEDALLACEASLPSSDDREGVEALDLHALKRQYETLVQTVKTLQAYVCDPAYGDTASQYISRCETLIMHVCYSALKRGSVGNVSVNPESAAWAQEHINATSGDTVDVPLSSSAFSSSASAPALSSASASASASSASVSDAAAASSTVRVLTSGQSGPGRGGPGQPRAKRDPRSEPKNPQQSFNTRIRALDKAGQLLISRADQHAREAKGADLKKTGALDGEPDVSSATIVSGVDSQTMSRYEELKDLTNEHATRLVEVLSEKREIELACGMGANQAKAQFLSLFYGPTVGNFVTSAGEGRDKVLDDLIARIFFAANRCEGSSTTQFVQNKRFKPSTSSKMQDVVTQAIPDGG